MVTNESELQAVISIIEEKMNGYDVHIDRIERALATLFLVAITIENDNIGKYEKKYGTYSIDTIARTMKKL